MPFDQELLTFIREHIRSVWALELLLLLRRSAERRWHREELVRELRASPQLIDNNLAALARAGLTSEDEEGRFGYSPAALVLDKICTDLELAYRERPVSVINVISSPPDKLQSLADAFRLRPPK